MIAQSQGKMLLAAERGHTESDWFRSYNTFNFGNYRHPDKAPFHSLYVCNNDTLASGKSFTLLVEEDSEIIIIPTVGAIHYSDSTGNTTEIEAGQAQRFATPAGTTISFKNPFEEDMVNFLQLWIKKPVSSNKPPSISEFDLEANKNKLLELFTDTNATENSTYFFIGKFKGREEVTYHLPSNKGLFIYVLEGAYEVAYRLLEAGDALTLWDAAKVEIEALSNDAIILLVEIPLDL